VVASRSKHSALVRLYDLYLYIFYSTNSVLNFTLSLTLIVPLQVAEMIGDVGSWRLLLSQLGIALFLTYLYSVIYVVNDFVDFQSDLDNAVEKRTLMARHRSYLASLPFLILVVIAIILAFLVSPRLAPYYLAYLGGLMVLAWVHSNWPVVKPLTFFMERASRFLAPAFFIYFDTKTTIYTLTFLLACCLTYPIVLHRQYHHYLEVKRAMTSGLHRLSALIYSGYYVFIIVLVSLSIVTNHTLQLDHVTRLKLLGDAVLGVIVLIGTYLLVYGGLGIVAKRVPARWLIRTPYLTEDRRVLLLRITTLLALAILLVVVEYAR
jgi:hypothetical protein